MSDTSRISKPVAHLEVARAGTSVLLRIVELGNMSISLTLEDFVNASLQEGYRQFALDLGRCTGMDSTFMGTVVGLSKSIRERDGWLCMLNVSDENQKLLALLGVNRFVPVKEQFPVQAVETTRLMPDNDPSRRLEQIRQAHQILVAIDERNRERFGAFLDALDQEMGQFRGEKEPGPASTSPSDLIVVEMPPHASCRSAHHFAAPTPIPIAAALFPVDDVGDPAADPEADRKE